MYVHVSVGAGGGGGQASKHLIFSGVYLREKVRICCFRRGAWDGVVRLCVFHVYLAGVCVVNFVAC